MNARMIYLQRKCYKWNYSMGRIISRRYS